MALNTVSSDRLSTNVKNTNFTAAEKQDLTDDILPLAGQLGNRNLIINGAMQVAQRGTSSTSTQYQTVDRFKAFWTGQDEHPTQAQGDVAAGTTPYTSGFRKTFKLTNGNQTSGADAADYFIVRTLLEAQDIANSGWNYVSSSSNITLSFWIKSSVAQNFYGNVQTKDGTIYNYPFETGSLSADTWTKITKTIPGNSNLQFDNNTDEGLRINIYPLLGTDYTASSVTLNQWAAFSGSTQTPDQTTTWWTTNDATLELTGIQLEVGSVATDFEHRSFGQELALCQRYYQRYQHGTYKAINFVGRKSGSNTVVGSAYGFPPMRAAATGTINDAGGFKLYRVTDGTTHTPSGVTFTHDGSEPYNVLKFTAAATTYSTGDVCTMTNTNTGGILELDAEP